MSDFVDECNINVRGGDGGAGSVSFRREAHVARGGPDGGDGGKGGDVWFVADTNVASLLAFRDHPHRRAGKGGHGSGKRRHGATGEPLEVRVPVGTTVSDFEGTPLADLSAAGDRWLAATGGAGGRGNARFLTNKRRAPSFAEQGEHGEERWLRLELKLLADVALVGFPNAGKSTLISRISAAKPKIGDYPFTTLQPNLGVVRLDNPDFEMVVADIPGLIEGASEGRGLGHQFLRHIERASVLVVLLDLAPMDERPPAEQERILLTELERYEPDLLRRPRLVVGSKADVATHDAGGHAAISAVTGEGIPDLLGAMAGAVREARSSEHEPVGMTVVHRPVPEGISIERTMDGGLRVVGRDAERAVALSDLTNPDALAYAQHRLEKLGVDRELARAGAKPGDTVYIGDIEFEYAEDGLA